VDGIIVYSYTYEEHIKHLDAVLGKLTTAGFTINIDKCDFCKQEINFLEVCDGNGKFRGQFNLKSVKVYKQANDMS
jgi:hypothetical protein